MKNATAKVNPKRKEPIKNFITPRIFIISEAFAKINYIPGDRPEPRKPTASIEAS